MASSFPLDNVTIYGFTPKFPLPILVRDDDGNDISVSV
ncbi:hypothetical protein KSS87_009946 [Heliosperma pusillum]|nr:hypothetical protein KSS87_009946 [Heliosperma pusillum]